MVRAGLLAAAPFHAFVSDHIDFMVWSEWAYEHGPTSLYELPANLLINARMPLHLVSQPVVTPYPSFNRCNYPPLSGYLFWLPGWLWQAVDDIQVENSVADDIAAQTG